MLLLGVVDCLWVWITWDNEWFRGWMPVESCGISFLMQHVMHMSEHRSWRGGLVVDGGRRGTESLMSDFLLPQRAPLSFTSKSYDHLDTVGLTSVSIPPPPHLPLSVLLACPVRSCAGSFVPLRSLPMAVFSFHRTPRRRWRATLFRSGNDGDDASKYQFITTRLPGLSVAWLAGAGYLHGLVWW